MDRGIVLLFPRITGPVSSVETSGTGQSPAPCSSQKLWDRNGHLVPQATQIPFPSLAADIVGDPMRFGGIMVKEFAHLHCAVDVTARTMMKTTVRVFARIADPWDTSVQAVDSMGICL